MSDPEKVDSEKFIPSEKIAALMGDGPLGQQYKLRQSVLNRDRTGWTRQEWIDDARQIMDDLYGSVESLLNGHILALLSTVSTVEDQVAAGYAEGYEAGRCDYIAKVSQFFDELIGRT